MYHWVFLILGPKLLCNNLPIRVGNPVTSLHRHLLAPSGSQPARPPGPLLATGLHRLRPSQAPPGAIWQPACTAIRPSACRAGLHRSSAKPRSHLCGLATCTPYRPAQVERTTARPTEAVPGFASLALSWPRHTLGWPRQTFGPSQGMSLACQNPSGKSQRATDG